MEFEKEYFDGIYEGDYEKRNPRYKFKAMIREILRFKKEGSLLDIGCAYGKFLEVCASRTRFKLSGIDISEHAVEVAKKRLKGKGIELRKAGVLDTGFKDNSFDVVCLFDVLEHIEDLSKAFDEIKRILRKDGIVIFSVPVYDGLAGRIVGKLDIDPTHCHKEKRGFWLDITRGNRLKILRWIGILRYFLGKRFYIHKQTKLFRKHTPAIMIIAKWSGDS